MRGVLARLHRWAGLATAAFLIVAGLTGSVIAFNHELDEWLNPELFLAPGRGETMSPYELAARIEHDDPRARITYIPLAFEPGRALVLGVTGRLDPATGKPREIGYNQVFLDPVSGRMLGRRDWGALRVDRAHLVPFLYALHYTLHLPERWGVWLMGVVAIAWMLDCFVGLYLTLPRGRPLLSKWGRSWKIRSEGSATRFNFDLHRASGLWLWGLLLVMSLSAVYLNLQFEVFRPVLSRLTVISPHPIEIAMSRQRAAGAQPGITFENAVGIARRESARRGWPEPFDIFYSPEFGAYGVGFGDHHAPGVGVPYRSYDDQDGRVLGETVPGAGTAADVFMQWLFPLHSGQIAGLAGRIVVCITGLAVALLAVTGVIIWARKRRA